MSSVSSIGSPDKNIYYSQSKEDIYLNNKYFKNKTNGIYMELGALDGILYSNTKFFEDTLDWTGILIEPHPLKYKLLRMNRPKNYLFNDLVSYYAIDTLRFRYFVNYHAAVSGVEDTLSQFHLDYFFDAANNSIYQQKTIDIKPKTLTDIVKSTNITHIDFFSLDVEGHEYEVLLSWDFSIKIDIILIETLGVQSQREELCKHVLLMNGYKLIEKYEHNDIYSIV
jgi:FkbM family methyltransferase